METTILSFYSRIAYLIDHLCLGNVCAHCPVSENRPPTHRTDRVVLQDLKVYLLRECATTWSIRQLATQQHFKVLKKHLELSSWWEWIYLNPQWVKYTLLVFKWTLWNLLCIGSWEVALWDTWMHKITMQEAISRIQLFVCAQTSGSYQSASLKKLLAARGIVEISPW